MNPKEQALDHLETIADERRGVDPVSTDRLERMEDRVSNVVDNFFVDNNEKTLREFLGDLDLHFDPEEFMVHDRVLITPEVLAAAVYMDMYPETMGHQTSVSIFDKYIEPHTEDMDREEEFFMIEEYISRYY